MISDAIEQSTATKTIQPALTQTSQKHLDMGKVSLEPLNYDDLDNGDHDKHEKVIHIRILRSTRNSF